MFSRRTVPRDGAARAVLLRAEGKVFRVSVHVHEVQGLGPSQGAARMARFLAISQPLERLPRCSTRARARPSLRAARKAGPAR